MDNFSTLGEDPDIDGVDDLKEFKATQDAFKLLGFSSKEQQNIYKIMAGILHLGNVHFDAGSGKMDSESCSIPSSDESLKHFAELFEIEEDQIRSWLCNRKIVTARESYVKPVGAEAVKFAKCSGPENRITIPQKFREIAEFYFASFLPGHFLKVFWHTVICTHVLL